MTLAFITILMVITAGAVFYFRPNWGLVSVVFLLPFERIGSYTISGGSVRLVQVAGLALIFAVAMRILTKKQRFRYFSYLPWLAGLAGWALISVVTISYQPLIKAYALGIFVMLLLIAVSQVADRSKLPLIIKAGAFSVAVVSILGIFQFVGDGLGIGREITGLQLQYSKQAIGITRVHSTTLEPLFYANFLLVPIMVSLALAWSKVKQRRLAIAVFAITATNLILTTSRGGFIAAAFGIICLLWILKHHLKLKLQLKKTLLISLVILGVFLAGAGLVSMRQTGKALDGFQQIIGISTSGLFESASYVERRSANQEGINIIRQNPLWGVGIGGIGFWVAGYPPEAPTSEAVLNNQWLEVAAQTGIIGAVFYVGLIFSILRSLYRSLIKANQYQKLVMAGLLSGLLAMCLQLLSFSGFYITYVWVLFGIAAGVAKSTRKRHRAVASK